MLGPIALACLWAGNPAWAALVALAGAVIAAEWVGMTHRAPRRAVGGAAGTVLGLAYVAAAGEALVWLRDDDRAGWANVLFVVLVVWASDVGAYLAGRLIGGPRLAPGISPSKTWAGAAGGFAAALATGGLFASTPEAVGAAALLGLAAQAGDLGESALKRRIGVKDSGRLIPGHGGLLDRLDGLLLASLAAAALALARGPGVMLWE